MPLAVIDAIVVADGITDLARLDGYGLGVQYARVGVLFNFEPDSIRAGVGEAGQSSTVCAVPGGRVGYAHAIGGNVQRDGVRFAVIIAGVATDRVLDLAQFHDGHAGGIHDGFAVLLLQLEPDGIRTRLGEAGQSSAVCAVLGGRVGYAHALGGNEQADVLPSKSLYIFASSSMYFIGNG